MISTETQKILLLELLPRETYVNFNGKLHKITEAQFVEEKLIIEVEE